MELWTEYEGRTIDGAFPLKKLLLPEGRSAFFSTSNGKGEPTVIRLIASHFDEDEILARWRGVEALGHPNILRLERFGQLVLDDTTVVYAVMEPVDANLAEVVSNQRLTVPEARQLAASLASALEILHSNGFVHEHVEPANIYAVGEVVKLRGDCIRETPEGQTGLEAKKRDIHNLGVVLLESLAQQQSLDAPGPKPALAAPFDRLVPNALNGSWTLAEIRSAIGPVETSAPATPYGATHASAATPVSARGLGAAAVPAAKPASAVPVPPASSSSPREMPLLAKSGSFGPPAARPRIESPEGLPRVDPRTLWTAAVVAVILAIWLIWHFAHSAPSSPATQSVKTAPSAATTTAVKPSPSQKPTRPAARTSTHVVTPDGAHEQWRVIAFTYNFQDQAQKKAAFIAQSHPDLHPEVFTPTGRAPYLVTVGGSMNHDAAYALMHRSSHWGLPKDTYAQNYTGKAH